MDASKKTGRINTLYHKAKDCIKESDYKLLEAIELEVSQIRPNTIEEWKEKIKILSIYQDKESVLNHYNEAIKIYPEVVEFRERAIEVLIKLGKIKKALEHYHKIIDLDSQNPERYIDLGILYYGIDNFENSLIYYRKAHKLNSENSLLFHYMGKSLFHLGDFDEAELCFKKVLELEPDYARNWYFLGLTYSYKAPELKIELGINERKRCYEKAVNCLIHCVHITPNFQKAWTELKSIFSDIGYFHKALHCGKIVDTLKKAELLQSSFLKEF